MSGKKTVWILGTRYRYQKVYNGFNNNSAESEPAPGPEPTLMGPNTAIPLNAQCSAVFRIRIQEGKRTETKPVPEVPVVKI